MSFETHPVEQANLIAYSCLNEDRLVGLFNAFYADIIDIDDEVMEAQRKHIQAIKDILNSGMKEQFFKAIAELVLFSETVWRRS
jgi:hypothetical protein